jgi:hypothetical protein
MDPNNQPVYTEQSSTFSPYQQQQLDNWKNKIKKFMIAAWPYIMRGMNEFILILTKVIRGSIQIMKNQLLNRS